MATPLRVLIVEDSEDDAFLLLRELRRGGYEPTIQRVDSEEGLTTALDQFVWDIVICDYKMPGFDGPSALELFRKRRLDIPFIIVSGLIGEDVAVGMMKAGAHDYLLKSNLARLVPAIDRELREASERREHRRAEEARSHLAAVVQSSEDGIISTTPDGRILSWNSGAEKIFGYNKLEASGQPVSFLLSTQQGCCIIDMMGRIMRGEQVARFQAIAVRKDGKMIDVSMTISPIKDVAGNITGVSTIARDITERKRAESEREMLVTELQEALAHVKTLSGLLPICASCKKIRDDTGYWQQVEIYIQKHSRAAFTHGFCPDCIQRLYPDFAPRVAKAAASG
jgi:PAS domain S-box-containing protein